MRLGIHASCHDIEDRAYLRHRGLLLDCQNFELDFVKEVIEVLACKMNVPHYI